LALKTGLSVRKLRTVLNRLKLTGEMTSRSTNNYSIFKVINYEKYQQRADEMANKGQAKGKQRASKQQCK